MGRVSWALLQNSLDSAHCFNMLSSLSLCFPQKVLGVFWNCDKGRIWKWFKKWFSGKFPQIMAKGFSKPTMLKIISITTRRLTGYWSMETTHDGILEKFPLLLNGSQTMQTCNVNWILEASNLSAFRYVIWADLLYPVKLHGRRQDFPLAPPQ